LATWHADMRPYAGERWPLKENAPEGSKIGRSVYTDLNPGRQDENTGSECDDPNAPSSAGRTRGGSFILFVQPSPCKPTERQKLNDQKTIPQGSRFGMRSNPVGLDGIFLGAQSNYTDIPGSSTR
jgi:hypothetical protein